MENKILGKTLQLASHSIDILDEILTIEVPDWEERIISFPKKKLEDLKNLNATYADHSGIYFLWNKEKKVYIGQATDLKKRLNRHKEEKYWWNMCIFVTNTNNLDTADLDYLESMFIKKAKEIGINLDNDKEGKKNAFWHEDKKKYLNSFIDKILSILEISELNEINIFSKHKRDNEKQGPPHRTWSEKISEEKFSLEKRGCNAIIVWEEAKKIIIKKGSKLADHYQDVSRDKLEFDTRKYSKDGFIKGKSVEHDIPFKSLNEAATFCGKGSTNVWQDLKNEEGKSLDEICKEIYITTKS